MPDVVVTRYIAKDGAVWVREESGGLRRVHSALTANGRDVERFERAAATAARGNSQHERVKRRRRA